VKEVVALIRLSKSVLGEREQAAVSAILQKGYLGMGEETRRFEEDLAAYLGDDRLVACVSTGTAALHLALQACGIGQGDEVLVPSLTYLASFQAISATGAIPVACEVNESTCILDPSDLELRITPRTRAIMPVHYASSMADLARIYEIATQNRLRVIEDAAHAFGCTYQGQRVGSTGDVVCFSFDGIKNITSGEGGAVVTADGAVHAFVQDSRLLGVRKDSQQRYKGERSWEFEVFHQGYRYHMSDLMAAIGRVQLSRLEKEFKPRRVELAMRYSEAFRDAEGIRFLEYNVTEVIPHIFPIRVLNGLRNRVRQHLLDNEVQVGIHYMPNHLHAFYGNKRGALPVTERIYGELLSLPLHPDLSNDEQDRVIEIVYEALC
jgi:dTDP-4-amino-4,6-dideoxygalactose transaminase